MLGYSINGQKPVVEQNRPHMGVQGVTLVANLPHPPRKRRGLSHLSRGDADGSSCIIYK